MAFIDYVLQTPSYGWQNEKGELVVPTRRQLLSEAFSRMNIFSSRKNWLAFTGWFIVLLMLPLFVIYVINYISIATAAFFIVYSMIIAGTHATIWYHRYCSHRSYTYSHPIWRIITQNLVIKTVPEETYAVSHHVHHSKSDEPGDPYNARAGFLYCMLADVNHQGISKSLNEADYKKASGLLKHTGIKINSYKQYQRWGTISSPYYTIGTLLLNWALWYGIFYALGGHALATAAFGAAMFWYVLVRAFNYTGHGKGEHKHVDGVDFDRSNLSVNQMRPGLFAGEWHNNHHLYPSSARAGFLPYQLDLPWIYIKTLHALGAVSAYRDSKNDFLKKYAERLQEEKMQSGIKENYSDDSALNNFNNYTSKARTHTENKKA